MHSDEDLELDHAICKHTSRRSAACCSSMGISCAPAHTWPAQALQGFAIRPARVRPVGGGGWGVSTIPNKNDTQQTPYGSGCGNGARRVCMLLLLALWLLDQHCQIALKMSS